MVDLTQGSPKTNPDSDQSGIGTPILVGGKPFGYLQGMVDLSQGSPKTKPDKDQKGIADPTLGSKPVG